MRHSMVLNGTMRQLERIVISSLLSRILVTQRYVVSLWCTGPGMTRMIFYRITPELYVA